MNKITRRDALGRIGQAGLVLGSTGVPLRSQVSGASPSEEVRVAVIGIGVKGRLHVGYFGSLPGVKVVAVVDVDPARVAEGIELAKKAGSSAKGYSDARHVLDRKDIDAIVIATPNHWHGLLTIWGCQAGKHVYVEKPACHNIWEGQKMLEAERRYDRIVQVGTQNRSNAGFSQTAEYLRKQPLGKIKWIQGRFNKLRNSIGMTPGPQSLPKGMDYDLFCGPAPLAPVRRKRFHYDWHWDWDTGNGDLGNNGPHITDEIRQIMGDDIQPSRVMSYGGRFLFNDSGVTPNTLAAIYDYDGIPCSMEIRNLPMKPSIKALDHFRGVRIGCYIQCEHGHVIAGEGGGIFYDADGNKIKTFSGDGGTAHHHGNFIDAVRAGDRSLLNAPLEVGVRAAELFLAGNLSWRIGSPDLAPNLSSSGDIDGLPLTGDALRSIRSHLEINGVNLKETPLTYGPWLSVSNKPEGIKSSVPETQKMLDALLKPSYRAPYTIS
ncbi:MAG: Gfo/Idh/MocA family protein [Puniceicoccaceae bacterium]